MRNRDGCSVPGDFTIKFSRLADLRALSTPVCTLLVWVTLKRISAIAIWTSLVREVTHAGYIQFVTGPLEFQSGAQDGSVEGDLTRVAMKLALCRKRNLISRLSKHTLSQIKSLQ